jgi:hypothetical protein
MPEDMVGDVGINTTPGSDAHFPGTQHQPAWATVIADSSAITIQHFTIRKHCLLDCFHANLHPASYRFFFRELLLMLCSVVRMLLFFWLCIVVFRLF